MATPTVVASLCLERGTVYRYMRLWRAPGTNDWQLVCLGRYRVLGLAQQARVPQEVVVYEGIDGKDAGRLYVCTVADFAQKFEREPEPEPRQPQQEQSPAVADAAPEVVVDMTERGTGY